MKEKHEYRPRTRLGGFAASHFTISLAGILLLGLMTACGGRLWDKSGYDENSGGMSAADLGKKNHTGQQV